MLVGYQAEGTRGRRLLDGEPTVRMFGIDVPVKCNVTKIDGLSAHGDQSELIQWLGGFTNKPKMTFLVHGEVESARAFAKKINEDMGWNTFVPEYLESFHLFEGI